MTNGEWVFLALAVGGVGAMATGCALAWAALYRANRNAARRKAREAEQWRRLDACGGQQG